MHDPFLKSLNSTVNNFSYSFGVTLVVGGGVISGTLISAKTYFEEFAETFSGAWPGGSDVLRDGLAGWGQEDAADLHPEFIHLKDARYVSGPEFAPSSGAGILWRGNIESVNGFSLGAFSKS